MKIAWGITGSGDKINETIDVMKNLKHAHPELGIEVFLSKAGATVAKVCINLWLTGGTAPPPSHPTPPLFSPLLHVSLRPRCSHARAGACCRRTTRSSRGAPLRPDYHTW